MNDSARKEGRIEGRSLEGADFPPLLFTRLSACVHKSRTLIPPKACILSLLAWTERRTQKQQNEILIRGWRGRGGLGYAKLAQWFT